jgi:hypothetical protein
MGASFSELPHLRLRDLGVRFAFGAAISLVAGAIGLAFGAPAGGMFLAFPAILPASLTLIHRKNGPRAAVHDLDGSVLGAAALGVFAVAAGAGLRRSGAGIALPAALAAWLGTSIAGYVALECLRRRIRRRGQDQRR